MLLDDLESRNRTTSLSEKIAKGYIFARCYQCHYLINLLCAFKYYC